MFEQLDISLLLDICLLVMLGATISYCLILNNKLNQMRLAQSEMQKIAKGFDQSIIRSKLGVEELKSLSVTKGAELRQEISKAEKLIEELDLMAASGSRIADRMQSASTRAKRNVRAAADKSTVTPTLSEEPTDAGDVGNHESSLFRTDAEKELIHALTKADN